jgi:arylsulfatase A-like enzyme
VGRSLDFVSRVLKIAALFVVVLGVVFVYRRFTQPTITCPTLGYVEKRIRVTPPGEHEDVLVEMQRSRRMESRITSDVRDAMSVHAFADTSLEIPVVERGSIGISTAFTIQPVDPSTPLPAAQVEYSLELWSGDKSVFHVEAKCSLADAASEWHSIRFSAQLESGNAILVFSNKVVPAEGVDLSDRWLRACWSMPEITKERPEGPNLLVISIDTLRADRLGCYGYSRDTSPNIDRLVARGALFENAISSAPWTLPSYGSLFTGLYPASHRAGVVTGREALWGKDEIAQGKGQKLSETLRTDIPTLAKSLADAGWKTAAFYNNPFLDPSRRIDRGFQQYTSYQYNAASGVDLAERWIAARSQSRWFVFLHLMDPHGPYAPPAPYDEKFAGRSVDSIPGWPPDLAALRAGPVSDETKKQISDLYDGEIAFADAQIGRLLDALDKSGEAARTLIVFHSDHGEEFWEHGGFEHGHSLHSELLHVPLAIVFPPRMSGGTRVAPRVRTVDVFPTVLELMGLAPPRDLDGESLLPLLDGSLLQPRDALSESILWGEREAKAFAREQFKLIAAGSSDDHLFAPSVDAAERIDLERMYPDSVRDLRAWLAARHERLKAIAPTGPAQGQTLEELQRLRNTGYAGAEGDE